MSEAGKKFNKSPKGKSQHKKNKRSKSSVPAGPKAFVPVNLYVSKCCNALGKKTPCARQQKDREANKPSQSTLGKFRCSSCGKRAVFNREPNSKGESIIL